MWRTLGPLHWLRKDHTVRDLNVSMHSVGANERVRIVCVGVIYVVDLVSNCGTGNSSLGNLRFVGSKKENIAWHRSVRRFVFPVRCIV
jgi:hypothetical protein